MKADKVLYLIYLLVFAILITIIGVSSSGCAIAKSKKTMDNDSTGLKKDDTGNVSKDQASKVLDWEWFKTTLQYMQPKNGDTTINHIYYSPNLPQPQVIIMEGGKGSQVENSFNYDSAWKKTIDSIAKSSSETVKEKESETKGVGITFVIVCCLATLLASKLLSFFGSNFKIIKK